MWNRLKDAGHRGKVSRCNHGETLIALALLVAFQDTIRITRPAGPIRFDGVASSAEHGTPAVEIATAQGKVQVWLSRVGDTVYVAAHLPDSTYYWGDDFVVSIDPLGDRTPGPGHDDTQWYLRRMLDSSVAYQGRHGRWMPPGDDPDWRLGSSRGVEGGWDVRSASDEQGWSVELRLPAEWFSDSTGRRAGIAFRSYDDAPHGWYAWPSPPSGQRATVVEGRPELWAVVE